MTHIVTPIPRVEIELGGMLTPTLDDQICRFRVSDNGLEHVAVFTDVKRAVQFMSAVNLPYYELLVIDDGREFVNTAQQRKHVIMHNPRVLPDGMYTYEVVE